MVKSWQFNVTTQTLKVKRHSWKVTIVKDQRSYVKGEMSKVRQSGIEGQTLKVRGQGSKVKGKSPRLRVKDIGNRLEVITQTK